MLGHLLEARVGDLGATQDKVVEVLQQLLGLRILEAVAVEKNMVVQVL